MSSSNGWLVDHPGPRDDGSAHSILIVGCDRSLPLGTDERRRFRPGALRESGQRIGDPLPERGP